MWLLTQPSSQTVAAPPAPPPVPLPLDEEVVVVDEEEEDEDEVVVVEDEELLEVVEPPVLLVEPLPLLEPQAVAAEREAKRAQSIISRERDMDESFHDTPGEGWRVVSDDFNIPGGCLRLRRGISPTRWAIVS
jgi:hypothetical protein